MSKSTIRKIILLTGCTTASIHMINKLIFYVAKKKDLLSITDGEYYDWRFGKIYFHHCGSGSPVLLLHDLTEASSGAEWRKIVFELAKTHSVYVLDLMGCGRSEKANITYTNFFYVQLIQDFVRNVIKHKTSVAATGLSGSFTIMACHNNPELFDKILLINPLSLKRLAQTPTKRNKTAKFLLNLPILGTFIFNILTSKNILKETFEENYYYDNTKIEKTDIDTYFEAAHRGGPNSRFLFSSLKSNYVNISIRNALEAINNSIYIIGGNDLSCIHATAEEYLIHNQAIETAFIKESKHLPQLENPKAVLNLFSLFLGKES